MVIAVLRHMTNALLHLRKLGIIHRDIKPENILLGQDGKLKLCDLGLAIMEGDEKNKKELVGTSGYVPPEVLVTKTGWNNKSDIWSLGAVMFELLTGRRPFEKEVMKWVRQKPEERKPYKNKAILIAPIWFARKRLENRKKNITIPTLEAFLKRQIPAKHPLKDLIFDKRNMLSDDPHARRLR